MTGIPPLLGKLDRQEKYQDYDRSPITTGEEKDHSWDVNLFDRRAVQSFQL